MDVRSIVDVEPEVEHNGTVPVWYLVHPREMKDLTDGGHLELVDELQVTTVGQVLHLPGVVTWSSSTSSRSRTAVMCSRTRTRRTSSIS